MTRTPLRMPFPCGAQTGFTKRSLQRASTTAVNTTARAHGALGVITTGIDTQRSRARAGFTKRSESKSACC